MLRVNGEDLSTFQPGHPFLKVFNDAMKALEGMKLPAVTIQEAKRKQSRDADGNLQHSNGCFITCSQRYQHRGTSYRCEYYETITYQDEREKLLPLNFDFDGTSMELRNDPKEKIFFILFVDPQCERVDELEFYQNEIRRPAEFSLVQKERDTKEKVKRGREKAELEMMLYSLENDHDQLLDVCYNFEIQTEGKPDYELVERLMNIVLMTDDKGNYNRDTLDKFRSVVKPENGREQQLANLKSLLGRLIDNKVVIAHGTAAGGWYLDEEKQNKVCGYSARQDKKEALANYFITHRDQIPVFEEKLKQLTPA